MLKKGTAVGREFVAEHGSGGNVLNRGKNVIAELIVVVLEDRHGDSVVVRVDGVGGVLRNFGKSGCCAWIPGECLLVKACMRSYDGFTRNGVGIDVDGRWVVPAVGRSRHVSFELGGLAKAEDDDFAMFVDDALCCECVEVRSTN